MDEGRLRERIREAIAADKLPDRRPDHTWGGFGSGTNCALCGETVSAQETELELDFGDGRGGRICRVVHAPCFNLWESERKNLREPQPPGVKPAARKVDSSLSGSLPRTGYNGSIVGSERKPNPRGGAR